MHIQQIIIDGFKSYAHRTVVDGFDPHFNAITGLNGSGKSNILDSICFVLGITNLSQVRAGNLSELVYKQGQAGVNKATVTIIFNNEDPSKSPVGYEQFKEVTVTRQVLIGGKSKYLINGRTTQAGQVQNLFHSVQLNVNNPHFLIMQGRITKVLNMKPHEILGMVEEAAGTRLYESKRVAALKTIEKKQAKVDELNSILSEEITPTLERLRGEKQNYLKWSKNNADIERIERFVVASEFMKAQTALENNSEGSTNLEEQAVQLEKDMEQYQKEIQEKEEQIEACSSQLQGEMAASLKQAKATEEKYSKELVKITSAWKNSKDSVKKAEKDLDAAKALVEETKAAATDKERDLLEETQNIDKIRADAKEAEESLNRLTTDYQNMSAGISSSRGDEGATLPQQISKAHNDSKTAEAKIKQAKMTIKHLSKELKSVESELKKQGKSADKLSEKRDNAKAKVAELQETLDRLTFNPDEFNELEKEKSDLQSVVADLSERVDALSTQLSARLSFNYSDPVKGFDRSKVKGLVAKLINIKNLNHSTALEVTAGGKLYQVVVDEAITGKALLDRGKLKTRVTIIPLDKIQPRQVGHNAQAQASSIAGSHRATASPAIDLVGFDEEIRTAIEYVFGSTIIVDNSRAANEICDRTRTRTVTLEGDVYDPSGTISGGSANNLGSTLSKLSELALATTELEQNKARLVAVSEKLSKLSTVCAKFESVSAQLDLSQAELAAAEKHLSMTSVGLLVARKETMTKELEAAEAECIKMEGEKAEKWQLYENLKAREKELTLEREKRLRDIENAVKKAKIEAAKKVKLADEAESQTQTMSIELDSLKSEIETANNSVTDAEKALKEANEEESSIQMKVGDVKAKYEDAKAERTVLDKRVTSCTAELVSLKKSLAEKSKLAEKTKLEIKKVEMTIARIRKERDAAEKLVSAMLNKYAWIESEKSAFGVAGGDYDFQATDPSRVSKHLKDLKEEQDSLSKKINKKVMGMIEKAEGEYTELLRKRKVVENDKKKIQAVIEELDVKKKTELERTWTKVNKDFGSIFTTLLPGTQAKLEPPEGLAAWEGLEVKVAFGNVWKESLIELSGGQRSLLALSLILSLLLFKPAPMYILDEVDAALDLSHTQNIGNMLKTHFSQSQFIVVSLKEGMFNNANVIFRTKFVDGVSTVTKTIGTGSSRSRVLADKNTNDDYDTGVKAGRGKSGRKAN